MNRRRITFTLGAAAGGLLGAAFLPVAVASADDYGPYDIDPISADTVTDGGVRNFFVEVPPAAEGSVQGIQQFGVDVTSGMASTQVGTFAADVTNTTDAFGNTNQEILVTSDDGYTNVGTASGDVPPVGSLLDSYTYSSGISAVYTDIPSTTPGGPDTISYTWDTPLGDFKIPTTFDAIKVVVPVGAPGAGVDSSGDSLTGDTFVLGTGPGPTETISGVNGIAPADYDLLGTQTFDVDGPGGASDQVGTFTADFANSSDILGNTTQDLLVTSSTGDAPAVGSVYDYFFSDSADTTSGNGSYNVYSDIPTATGDKITDTIHSAFGTFNVPTNFDAAAGLAGILNQTPGSDTLGQTIDVPTAFDITPEGPGTIVGIDGIQPEDIDVQGTQEFSYSDFADPADNGTFDANVAQSAITFGNTTQDQYVVTDSTGVDAPQDGSVFEVYNYGHGYETVYSDLVGEGSNGHNLITEYFVSPFGDFKIADSYDAAAAYAADSSQNFEPASAAAAADLLSSVDPSALSSVDPSAAVDAGMFADLFPHAADLLSSLF